jgi:hypothetical protein
VLAVQELQEAFAIVRVVSSRPSPGEAVRDGVQR